MIDLHSHILPGIDDGADSLETALGMARSAVEDGVTAIAATPHVKPRWPTTADAMEAALAGLRAVVAEAGIPLELLSGGEIAFEELERLSRDDLRRFGLGGNPGYLLLELPDLSWPLALEQVVFELRVRGVTVVIAHPERSSEVQEDTARLERLVEKGSLVQVTAAALDGRQGAQIKRTAQHLLGRGLVHMVASDAHAPWLREIGLTAAAGSVGSKALARWLTEEVPRAIVAGQAIPERPQPRRFRPRGLRRLLAR